FFFFSSRRRHTRFSRDWSSDVCSSDLAAFKGHFQSSFLNQVILNLCQAVCRIDFLDGYVSPSTNTRMPVPGGTEMRIISVPRVEVVRKGQKGLHHIGFVC